MMRVTKSSLLVLLISFLLFALAGFAFGDEVVKKPAKAEVESIVTGSTVDNSGGTSGSEIFGIVKFEETFPDTIPPADWQAVDGDGSGTTWEYYEGIDFTSGDSVRPQAGAAFWANNFNNANGFVIEDWLLTPKMPALEVGDTLYVYVNAIGGTYPDTLTVWVSVTDSSLLNFDTPIDMIVDPGPTGEWHLYKLDITLGGALASLPVFVGFKHDHLDGGPAGSGSNWVHLDHVVLANGGWPTGIDDNNGTQPDGFVLKQNYPNPFNPTTTISYDLNKNAEVSLKVFNLAGQEVKTLVNENQSAGSKQVTWDGRDNNGRQVASGIYLYQLQAGTQMQTKKMVLLK